MWSELDTATLCAHARARAPQVGDMARAARIQASLKALVRPGPFKGKTDASGAQRGGKDLCFALRASPPASRPPAHPPAAAHPLVQARRRGQLCAAPAPGAPTISTSLRLGREGAQARGARLLPPLNTLLEPTHSARRREVDGLVAMHKCNGSAAAPAAAPASFGWHTAL
jgi:hypothetical protein